jgi:membrane peptidoglycan carboxypeptidase
MRVAWYWAVRLSAATALGVLLAGLVVVGLVVWPWWRSVDRESVAMIASHQAHDVSHPGWSFPATVWSAPSELDQPPAKIAMEARARAYVTRCPPAEPGEFCPKDGKVVPRGGHFPEGDQPAGLAGWTRPIALEPVRLGVLVGKDAEIRQHLPLEQAPKHLIAALLAAEDEGFREHRGVDFIGLGRAMFINARKSEFNQGASTLTMQLVRNLTQDKERSISRKLREIGQALAVDRHLGKDGVLQMYLDAPYLGQAGNLSICGFQAAAHYYWGIDAKDLSLAQAATLASILPAPGRFAPDTQPAEAKKRRDRTLARMAERGWDVKAALAEPVSASAHPPLPPEEFPAYLSATRAALDQRLPPEVVYGSGLEVWTALDVGIQDATDQLLDERSKYIERTIGRRGQGRLLVATALIDPRGAVIAAGDPSIRTSTDFNRATQARRQAGSSFKPMVFALAFTQKGADGLPKYNASSTVPNAPRTFEGTNGWRPRNIGGNYTASASLAYTLAMSQNIATASLLEEVGGPKPMIELAGRYGYDTSQFPAEMGLALGQAAVTPLEQARFAATTAYGGQKLEGSPIIEARDASGAVRLALAPPGDAVISPDAALLTRNMMDLVVRFGTGGSVHGGGGHPGYDGVIVGKTGTADDEKDLWFIGATPTYAGALWLGYDEPTRIGASASDLAAPFFGWWMRAVHEGLPREKWPEDNLEKKSICTQTGLLPGAGCHLITAAYLPGTAPKKSCNLVHPPPDPEAPVSEHVSLWQRLANEKAAEEGDPSAPPAAPPSPPTPPDEPAPE